MRSFDRDPITLQSRAFFGDMASRQLAAKIVTEPPASEQELAKPRDGRIARFLSHRIRRRP